MKKRTSSILIGLAFVLIGLGYLGNVARWWNFELFFDGWWTLIIIIPCIISMFQSGVNVGNTAGVIIGFLLLLNAWDIIPRRAYLYLWPLFLILVGVWFILRNPHGGAPRQNAKEKTYDSDHYATSGGYTSPPPPVDETKGSPNASPRAILTSVYSNFTNKEFTGAKCLAVLGGIELDLRKAIIRNDVHISATAVFGSIDIVTDEYVNVQYDSSPVFGGVRDFTTPHDASLPTVFIHASGLCGGIDIH